LRDASATLQVGWAEEDATPAGTVDLCGQYYHRVSEGVHSPLTVTVLALESPDGEQVTLARLGCDDRGYRLHVATAEARAPGKWEEAGWAPPAPQLPSLEMIFDGPVEAFVQNVMSQHYIVSYGDNRMPLSDLCSILGVSLL
jgi:hypothetical protein